MKTNHAIRTIILILTCYFTTAQNLVPNPSFETYTLCPNAQTQISRVSQWNRPPNSTGTPDYFNNCTIGTVGIPNNVYGTQQPFEGNAYVGIGTYYQTLSSTNNREYIQTQLTSPLVAGQAYQVSFYVSLSENPGLATNNMGAIFTVNQLTGNGNNQPINATPQILDQNIITDTTGWTQVSGIYFANGNEQYLTIGNFFDNAQTQTQVTGGSWGSYSSLYYIDNVSVTALLGLDGFEYSKLFVFPNPVIDTFSIANINNEKIVSLELFSLFKLVKKFNVEENIFDVKELPSGIYNLSITLESDRKLFFKLLKK
ncbi:MAG: T9SS type A sorting domain-containing protein [Flavobacteriales bacterium]|nr:T9SS type A sorting domain-containing protein [Flavobacteriales bacterium]